MATIDLTNYIKNDSDITGGFLDAISFLDSRGGGILNIPFKKDGYRISVGNIHLCNNLIINGNGNDFRIPSSSSTKNVFDTFGLSNVTINDLKLISTNDKVRNSRRTGLGSNVYGILIRGSNINISNVYFECLEAGIWVNDLTATTKNITVKNIESSKTKQPLFLLGISNSTFDNLRFDCADSVTDVLDHHIYMNGKTENINFNNLNFMGGIGATISLKSDNGADLNKGVSFKNVKVLNSSGVFLSNSHDVILENLKVINTNDTTGYGITIQGILNKHLTIKDFYLEGYANSINIGTGDNLEHVKFVDGFITKYASNAIAVNKCTNLIFDSVTFKNHPLDKDAYIFYTSPTSASQFTLKNSSFLFDEKPTRFLFSFRGNDLVILENNQFYNNGDAGGSINYNLSPAKVIAKNNYYKGFTHFKEGGDTATIEYTNIAVV